ncbi:uncharacterized protein G2W53_040255 [Senna tora]|uniref:Uncharacterized protein n=1 Tax=Senna tora TaxID=362788 RepID=A0A834T2J6_9FABA|nr:uncharacterized protein G2W53_040255 [Senna tora]
MRSRAPFELQNQSNFQIRREAIATCDHVPHSSIKSTRIPKYNAKQSISLTCTTTHLNFGFLSSFEFHSRFSIHNVFRQDLTHLPCDQVPQSSFKSAQIPKYNAKRLVLLTFATSLNFHEINDLPRDHEPHFSIKSNQILKYNAKRSSFHAIMSPIRAINPIGYPNTRRSDRHDLTDLPCNHETHSSIKSTRIPKYNAKHCFSVICATTRLNMYFLSSFEIQLGFSIHNVFRHNLKHIRYDHEPHYTIKSAQIPKDNANRSV